MGYKVKRGKSKAKGRKAKDKLKSFLLALAFTVFTLGVIALIGYLALDWAYKKFPDFQDSADKSIGFFKTLYSKFGLWGTIGICILIAGGIYAFGEESNRNDAKKQAMKDLMK